MKNVANILTFSRIILAIVLLLCFTEVTLAFIVIYFIAELTDMVDGTIARKTGSSSSLGSLLDSIADFLLYSSLIKIVFTLRLIRRKYAIWLACSLLIGLLSPIINYIRHKKVFFIHSVSCKLCGGALLLVPFAIYFGFFEPYLVFMLTIMTFALIELVIISIFLEEPDPNVRGIISLVKNKKTV